MALAWLGLAAGRLNTYAPPARPPPRRSEVFTPLVEKCKSLNRAMRIGTNHGSLSARILSFYGALREGGGACGLGGVQGAVCRPRLHWGPGTARSGSQEVRC